ncbi:MAG TPA: glycosyltransferase family 4 protein [Ferrovibrio sp.]|uniref:glycosyltransferase family 4 protein n=1 Tax=Ferrovibrio sp. TaxID=1917215 RepID=UPI002ED2DBEA
MSRRLLIVVQEALFFTTHRLPVGLAMQQRGWEVHVAAPADPAIAARLAAQGFQFHPIPLARGSRSPFADLRLLGALAVLFLRLRPDLLHLVSIKPMIWGGMAARLTGVPAVIHAITGLGFVRRNEGGGLLRSILERLYRIALAHPNNLAIFQNGDDLAVFETGRMVQPGRWMMIRGCGVDMQRFVNRPEAPIDAAHPPIVMFPARLIGDKGLYEFVAAAKHFKSKQIPARFVLVGRRDPLSPSDIGQDALDDWVARGLVEYWGFSDDMPDTLAKAHVIAMPSFYGEGVPRNLIEACAVGRAIVTADAPGCREVVRHEENGLLVPARDAAATTSAIGRLLEDADLRRRLAAAGRAKAEAEFSVEHFVTQSLAAYRHVLGQEP